MRETEQIEMPLLLVLVPRMVATCFLLLLVLLLALRPVPEQLSKQHSTKHGALMLEGRGFGRPLRALTCSYNEDTTAASWRAIQVLLESYSSGKEVGKACSSCPQPSPPCTYLFLLFGGISRRE
jgi:hypothetical protein